MLPTLCRVLGLSIVLGGAPAGDAIEMAYDLSPGRSLLYEYTFRELVGADAAHLAEPDAGMRMKARVALRCLEAGKVEIRLMPLEVRHIVQELDLGRFEDVWCRVSAQVDRSGGLIAISEPDVHAVAREGTSTGDDVKAFRLMLWPFVCRAGEMAIVQLPPVRRGPGQSWRRPTRPWGAVFPKNQPLFPFDFLKVGEIGENGIVQIVGGPEHDVSFPSDALLVASPEGIPGLPLSRREHSARIGFDTRRKAVVWARFVTEYETNTSRPGWAWYEGTYVARQVHEMVLLEREPTKNEADQVQP